MTHPVRITPAGFKLYGVIGYPLKHTLSPAMQEAAFRKLGLPCFYLALELDPRNFRRLMRHKKNLLLEGFNLTIPHKHIVLPFLDSLSPEARAIGAVNTVICRNGRWIGHNTDASGFLESLREEAGWRSSGKSVLVLGSGGAARACVYALAKDGARNIFIVNRTIATARNLARTFKTRFPKTRFEVSPLSRAEICRLLSHVSMVVNTTSVGLKKTDAPIIGTKDFPRAKGKCLAVDLIYNPPVTHFLRSAKRAGWKTVNGLGMLLHQGAASFELWTARKAPINVMRKALHGRMASVSF